MAHDGFSIDQLTFNLESYRTNRLVVSAPKIKLFQIDIRFLELLCQNFYASLFIYFYNFSQIMLNLWYLKKSEIS